MTGGTYGIFQKTSKVYSRINSSYVYSLDGRLDDAAFIGKISMVKFSGKIKKILVVFLAVVVTFLTTSPAVFAVTRASIEQKRRQTTDKIKKLKVLEGLEKNKMYKNQQKLETASTNLRASRTQYATLEKQLAKMEHDYAASIAEYNMKNEQVKSNIRKVFKKQRKGMFELLFVARDMNELLDTIYFEKIILKKDYARMQAIKMKSEGLQQMKAEINTKKQMLAASIQSINQEQKRYESAIAQNRTMINKLKNDRAAYERAERELARQSASLQAMINRSTGSSNVQVSSGGFLKPIGGRITSPFGWRTHPIFNSRTFHSGVDIGGPNYGNIVASNAGKVIYSGWYGGYGKVVILDHGSVNGKPTTTLYAHMSSILVSNGQQVNKGQVIGKEGTTGYSTGPHCHFEVRINGKPNNPLNYI